MHFAEAGAPVFGSHLPESRPGESFRQLRYAHIGFLVAFPLKRKHGIRPALYAPAHHGCKVNSQEREIRIRNWINEGLAEIFLFLAKLVVLSAEWYDLEINVFKGEPGDLIGIQACAVYHQLACIAALLRDHDRLSIAHLNVKNLLAQSQLAVILLKQLSILLSHYAIINNSGLGYVNAGNTSYVWLVLLHLGTCEHLQVLQPIGLSALVDRL